MKTKECENCEFMKDAMRYRFLRDTADPDLGDPYVSVHTVSDWGKWYNTVEHSVGMDKVIDDAMMEYRAQKNTQTKGGAK